MTVLSYVLSWSPFLVLFVIRDISADEFDFHQTIPAENGAVCPGGKLQYMCTALDELSWQISNFDLIFFYDYMELNSSETVANFSLLLIDKVTTESGIKIITTATNDLVTSNRDGQPVECYSGASSGIFQIQVADGPADCSKMSVVPECHATTNAMGDTDFSVTLPTSTSLMCVEGYQIQFNGESKMASLSSPSANFTVSSGEGQSVQNEIVVYTLDYENRAGQVPCTYNITAPDAVEQFLEPGCIMRTPKTVDITICWVPATVVGGCLTGSLPFLYIVESNDSRFGNGTTTSTSYTVTNITQETVVVITISPSLPFLGLTGPPLSETLNLASLSCLPGSSMILSCTSATPPMTSSIASTPTPTPSPGDDNQAVGIAVGITVPLVVLLLLLLVAVCIAALWHAKRKKSIKFKGHRTKPSENRCLLEVTPELVKTRAVEVSPVPDKEALGQEEHKLTVPVLALESGNNPVAGSTEAVAKDVDRSPKSDNQVPGLGKLEPEAKAEVTEPGDKPSELGEKVPKPDGQVPKTGAEVHAQVLVTEPVDEEREPDDHVKKETLCLPANPPQNGKEDVDHEAETKNQKLQLGDQAPNPGGPAQSPGGQAPKPGEQAPKPGNKLLQTRDQAPEGAKVEPSFAQRRKTEPSLKKTTEENKQMGAEVNPFYAQRRKTEPCLKIITEEDYTRIVASYEKKIEGLEATLALLHKENCAMKEEIRAKDQQLNTKDKELTKTKRKLMSLTQEKEEEVDKLKNDVENLKQEMEKLRSEKIRLNDELVLRVENEEALIKEVAAVKDQLKRTTEISTDASKKVDRLEERLALVENFLPSVRSPTAQKVENNSNSDRDSGMPPTDLEPSGGPEADCIPCIGASRGGTHERESVAHKRPRVPSSSDLHQIDKGVLADPSPGQPIEPPGIVFKAEEETKPHETKKERAMVGLGQMKESSFENHEDKSGKVNESDRSTTEYTQQPFNPEAAGDATSPQQMVMDGLPPLPKHDEGL